jgi:hypothetical protein
MANDDYTAADLIIEAFMGWAELRRLEVSEAYMRPRASQTHDLLAMAIFKLNPRQRRKFVDATIGPTEPCSTWRDGVSFGILAMTQNPELIAQNLAEAIESEKGETPELSTLKKARKAATMASLSVMTDRRAERNEILARADGWEEVFPEGWRHPKDRTEIHVTPPNYHSLDKLDEVLRGMTEEERREVWCILRGKAENVDLTGFSMWLLLGPPADDLAEAICAVIEDRDQGGEDG